ncbi:MAG: Sec-independent protein translocase protein TatB [Pseudomonadota bacterium]
MFDIGAMELLVIVIVAVLVIGPKDMPLAMRTAGRWIGKVRKVSSHFRTGIDAMVREAELEDMEKKWKARNEEIMREHSPMPSAPPAPPASTPAQASAEAAAPPAMTGPEAVEAPGEADAEPADPPPAAQPSSPLPSEPSEKA